MEEVENELMNYPPGIAWTMLGNLNNDLGWSPVWRGHYPAMRDRFRKRLLVPIEQQAELTEAIKEAAARPTYNYEAGSTHDDKRQQLSIGEVEEKKVQLKRIANE